MSTVKQRFLGSSVVKDGNQKSKSSYHAVCQFDGVNIQVLLMTTLFSEPLCSQQAVKHHKKELIQD